MSSIQVLLLAYRDLNGIKKFSIYNDISFIILEHNITTYFYFANKEVNSLPGQLIVWHGSFIVLSPLQLPPFASFIFFDLVFSLVPVPHDVEQS